MKSENEKVERVTNLDYLHELSKGNASFVKEMISIFLSENPEELKALEKGIKSSDYELVKTTAHKLRSTIPFIGLDKLIENDVSDVETMAGNKGDMQEIERKFTRIKEICEKAYYELQPV